MFLAAVFDTSCCLFFTNFVSVILYVLLAGLAGLMLRLFFLGFVFVRSLCMILVGFVFYALSCVLNLLCVLFLRLQLSL